MAHRIKKISILVVGIFLFLISLSLTSVNALPALDSNGLYKAESMGLPLEGKEATMPIVLIIKESIKYVGILAILVVSWGGITFLTSMGNDEKVKHAKHTIIYALIGVLLSVVAYTIIDIVNSLKI